MTDITPTILNYRKALLEIWNTYFLDGKEGVKNFEREVDFEFQVIQENLFTALVSAKEFKSDIKHNSKGYYEEIKVTIKQDIKTVDVKYVDKIEGLTTHWNNLLLNNTKHLFSFIEFFDWNTFDYMDGEFARLRLLESDTHPELVGKDFLINPEKISYFKKVKN